MTASAHRIGDMGVVVAAARIAREPLALSVVVPCFNEEQCLPVFIDRMEAACRAAAGRPYEIIFVNDGSQDGTSALIRSWSGTRPGIIAIDLMRNHGHQLAVSAGLAQARGERVLIIDADLQDPPELLGDMMRAMDDGADVVFGRRRSRAGDSQIKRLTAHVFYRILAQLSEVEIPVDAGDFRLMSRRMVDVLVAMPEQDRYLRGMVAWLGGRQTEILYDRDARYAGSTGYSLRKMLRLSVAGLTSFSTAPLKLAFMLMVFGMLTGVGIAAYALLGLVTGHVVPGWTSLALVMVFFATAQFACLAILGTYIGHIFTQVKNRPLYLIDTISPAGAVHGAAVDDPAAAHGEARLASR
jgi:dolichol-phosphate mannosyltransferase